MEFSEVIKRRKMIRAFTAEPLAQSVTDRLLRAANRAPSAGFSQGYSFLVLEGPEQCAPLWEILDGDAASPGDTPAEVRVMKEAMSRAPLVIVPLAAKDVYLDRYARPDKGWTDRDESHWPVPYWYIDTGFAALLILLAAVDEGLAPFFSVSSQRACQSSAGGSTCRMNGHRLVLSLSATPLRRPARCRRQRGQFPVKAWLN